MSNVVALAGGVGGAKLAEGLASVLGTSLTVIVNTGDDFEMHGLWISPDLDTVMYTLGGLANPATGWGIAGDTFNNLEMMSRYSADDWFRLGDRDLATHILRTRMLREGRTLTETTAALCERLGIRARILPMCDERVSTLVETDQGTLQFQEYFVHRRWQPVVRSVRFEGIERSRLTRQASEALAGAQAIILCPSNPFVSIAPVLAVPGVRGRIQDSKARRVAVSPIVGGEALRGPAAKMFAEMGVPPTALSVAERYRGLIDLFVLDRVDKEYCERIEMLGMQGMVTDTVMHGPEDRERLAAEILNRVKE
ncbi:MAG: 2-phospho-L-lactate transferase [Rudaea sp.]